MSAQQNPTPLPERTGSAGAPLPSPQQPAPRPVPVEEPPPPPRKAPGGLTALMFLLLGAGAGWWLYNQMEGATDLLNAASGGGPGGVLVRTAKVTTGDLDETIRLSGTIAAQSFAAIRAPQIRRGRRSSGGGGGAGLSGGGGGGGGSSSGGGGGLTIIEMAAPGSKVSKGQIVAQFDRQSQQQAIDDQQASVVQAGAVIDSTRAKLMIDMETKRQEMVTAKAEYEKAKMDVRTAEVRSEIEAEILKNLMQQAEAAYKQLEQEVKLLADAHSATIKQAEIDKAQEEIDLRRAEQNANYLVVKTPIPGVVVMQTIFRGGSFAQVALGDEVFPGAYFMQIVDPTSMVLEAKVNQADSQKIRVGSPADVHLDAYPEMVWPGRVASIAAMTGGGGDGRSRSGTGDHVREITVTIEILESNDRVIPDLSASADIHLKTIENVVIAPREALEQEGDAWFVRVRTAARNVFERRPVEVGPRTDTHVAVAAGLTAGEEVALEPPPPSK